MRKLLGISAVALIVAGCGSEAERFGYKGADLGDDDKMFFTTGVGVTNWVPARVLNVYEQYEMSEGEKALAAAAGVIVPSEPLSSIPEGYVLGEKEPWFATFIRQAENFGLKGSNGFVAHFDEDKKIWETGETWFSSYWKDEASAVLALETMKKTVAEKFAPKKIYDFHNCWVAEYLRMRVMCVVGLKADGSWSCMLNIQDKNRAGCGQWEPVEAQQERLDEYKYRKALKAWKEAKEKVLAENHLAVEKIREGMKLGKLDESLRPIEASDGRRGYVRGGSFEVNEGFDLEAFWKEKLAQLESAAGVRFSAEISEEKTPDGFNVRGIGASNEIYEVRIDLACPAAVSGKDEAAEEKPAAEGEEAREPAAPPSGEWRELIIEKMLDGRKIPDRPAPPQR